jgi:hypothetical protein
MLMNFSRVLRACAVALLAMVWLMVSGCGNGKSALPAPQAGPLSGNWQINLYQDYPRPPVPFGISGFLTQATDNLTGSLQVPALGPSSQCGGVSSTTGTISGQNVTLAINNFGSIINLTGTISSDNTSMSGDYQALGGACFTATTTGTWNALLIPPLNGSFTGTLDSEYLETVLGANSPVPITVSGTMSQNSNNAGTSVASLTGTINAVNYPCFTTATMSGTISGQNVYLGLFGYNGEQIGVLGTPPGGPESISSPATVVVTSTGVSLVDSTATSNGLLLGVLTNIAQEGPCPPISNGNIQIENDRASVNLNF